MKKLKYLAILISVVMSLLLTFNVSARQLAATAPPLGMVGSFAVLGASAVTSTGFTILNGDLGISPNDASSITGFPPGIYTGTLHAADGVALQAQSDATTAYNVLAGQPCTSDLTGQDLGGLELTPGVYCFDSSAQLTGQLTLNAQGDSNAVWIFKIGSTLTTASGSSVIYVNSDQPICNVFWQVGSSATLGTTTEFNGNIFADQSITMNNNANLAGRAVALNAAVTLDDNTITPVFCSAQPTATFTATATETGTIPTATETGTIPTATVTGTIPTATETGTIPTATVTGTPPTEPTSTVTVTGTPPTVAPPATATLLPIITGLPDTGGAPIRNQNSTWTLVIVGSFISAIALVLSIRGYRRYRLK